MRRYIDDTSNGIIVTRFQDPNLMESQARGIESPLSDSKYIYFR